MNELNKYINTRQFFKLYPEISKSTFWRWTKTGVKLRGEYRRDKNTVWSDKSYKLQLERMEDFGNGVSVRIPLDKLYEFFKQIGEEEWALRVPSYIRKITN
jgi:hypothetical protein